MIKNTFNKFITVLILLLVPHLSIALDSFKDFPNVSRGGDIIISNSALGKNYIKVSAFVSDAEKYILIYKSYENNSEESLIKQVESTKPEFNIRIDTLKRYEFSIGSYNYGNITETTPIEKFNATSVLNKTKFIRSTQTKLLSNGLELSLDIDQQSFPYVNLLAKITKDNLNFDGTDLKRLNDTELTIFEDGRKQPLTNLTPPEANSTKKIVDIVFVHDDSGSLGDEAAQVKANIETFLNGLDQSGIDYRIGLLPYGGGGSYSRPEGTVLYGGNIHNNSADLISDIDNMRFDGGTERAFDAMYLASKNILWRQSTQKVVILVTDENNDYGNVDEATITQELQNNNITLFGLTSGHSEFNRIADATGGKIFNITDNFSDILDQIGTEIVSRYILQYKSDNFKLDGVERLVTIDVNVTDSAGSIDGSVNGRYTPSAPIDISLTVGNGGTEELLKKGQQEFVSIPISALITQAGVPSNDITAKLFYRDSSGGYSSAVMNNIGNGLFESSIDASSVSRPKTSFYIWASDGEETYTYPKNDPGNNPLIISVLPNIAPEISNILISKAMVGNDLSIKASVEDKTNEVVKISLYYRDQGGNSYKSIVNEYAGEDEIDLDVTIPSKDITENGIEFYIDAVDDFGVHQTYGDSSNPIKVNTTYALIHNSSKTVGLTTIYANSIVDNGNNTWTASGNVAISRLNGSKILKISSAVIIDELKQTIRPISQTDITALGVRVSKGALEDVLLYTGDFVIEPDISSSDAVMKLQNGISKFRPHYGPVIQYPEHTKITIKDSEVEFSDAFTELTKLGLVGSIGALTLSQTESSKQPITFDFGDPLKFVPIGNSKFQLGGLRATWDWMAQTFEVEASLNLDSIFKGSGGRFNSISGILGFAYNPFELNTFGFGLGLSNFYQQAWRLPPIPAPIGVSLTSFSGKIDGISSNQIPSLSGQANMALRDSGNILSNIEKTIAYDPVTGNVIILIEPFDKFVLSGEIKLFEKLPLANAKFTVGNPASLEGNINLLDVVKGRVYLSAGASNTQNAFEISGQSRLSLNIPEGTPWIGGTELFGQSSYLIFSFNSTEIKQAELSTTYKLFFTDIGIRFNLENIRNPDLYVTGFGKEYKVFKGSQKSSKSDGLESFVIDKDTPYVFVKITSDYENSSADFNLTLPDGITITKDDAIADTSASNIDKIFYISNPTAKEAYYAIKTPEKGTYGIAINNLSELGAYNVVVVYPNDKPTITLDDIGDVAWDGSTPVQLSWNDSDKDDNAKISLYYSTKNYGGQGQLIVDNISEDDAADSFEWIPSQDIQSGDYYVFAKIDDGQFGPQFSYSPGKFVVENTQGPNVPQNIVVTPIDLGLKVKWDHVVNDANISYRVYVTEGTNTYDFSSGSNNEYDVLGLESDKEYSIQIQATNIEGYSSRLSYPIYERTPYNTMNPGGAPDLMIDTVSSTITSLNGKIDGNINVKVLIKNIGKIEASYAKVKCYYGDMSDYSLVGEKTLGNIQKDSNQTIEFSFNTNDFSKIDSRSYYIIISDVLSTELIYTNNVAVLNSSLTKNGDLNNDYEINILDIMKLQIMLDTGVLDNSRDINKDGIVDTDDLDIVIQMWGEKY